MQHEVVSLEKNACSQFLHEPVHMEGVQFQTFVNMNYTNSQ